MFFFLALLTVLANAPGSTLVIIVSDSTQKMWGGGGNKKRIFKHLHGKNGFSHFQNRFSGTDYGI